jgi:hypothetical protein
MDIFGCSVVRSTALEIDSTKKCLMKPQLINEVLCAIQQLNFIAMKQDAFELEPHLCQFPGSSCIISNIEEGNHMGTLISSTLSNNIIGTP